MCQINRMLSIALWDCDVRFNQEVNEPHQSPKTKNLWNAQRNALTSLQRPLEPHPFGEDFLAR